MAYHRGLGDAATEHLLAASTRSLALGNRVSALECLHDLARQGSAAEAAARLPALEADQFEGALHAVRVGHVRALARHDSAALGRCVAEFDRMGVEHLAAECALAAARYAWSARETQAWLRESARLEGSPANNLGRLLAERGATRREREVATLAVQGFTSRQIAEQLGNSHRTIEKHLSNVYAKLGVDGRLGLVELAS